MKKLGSLLCILLAACMLLGFAACGKKTGDAPSDDAVESAPSPEVSTPQPQLLIPDIAVPDIDPDLGLEEDTFVLINDVDEVLSRPRGIQQGSSFTICSYEVPVYLPWHSTAEYWLHPNIYEGLVYNYMGKPDDVRPLIAQSYTCSDDYLTWVFTIREGIKFTDGTVCDAAAVSASWDFYYEAVPTTFDFYNISSWEATGDMEFTVYLSAPCGYFESSLYKLYVLSPTALGEFGINDNRAAVSTAPYYVSEYNMGEDFVFKANENYYLYERYPVIETVYCKFIPGAQERIDAFENGEIDSLSLTRSDYRYIAADDNGPFNEKNLDAAALYSYGKANPIWLNAEYTPEFQIYEARKAMSRFIDLGEVNNAVYEGTGKVQTSIWSVGSSSEVPWPEGFYHDIDEGLALLAEAGVAPGELVIETYVLDTYFNLYENISSQLAEVGISLTVKTVEPYMSFTPWMSGDCQFHMSSSGYTDTQPYLPWTFVLLPEHLLYMVHTDLYDPELYGAMCDTYSAMLSSPTWDEMLENAKALTDMVQRDYSAIPGIQQQTCFVFDKDVKGVVIVSDDHALLWNYLYF